MTSEDHLSPKDVLLLNDRGDHTVPAARIYPFRWLWDSALIAVGWATFDERRAWTELDASMSAQWESGMVPHIDFGDGAGSYFPGPATWNTPYNSTGITQPPLTAPIALAVYKAARDRDLARSAAMTLWPKLVAFQSWLYSVRLHEETGLVLSVHPWETGLDNSPAWEQPMSAIDTTVVPTYVRKDTTHIDHTERPPQLFYDRCYALLIDLKSNGYDTRAAVDQCPFVVADTCINSIAVEASEALVELGRDLGQDVAEIESYLEHGRAGLATLWSDNVNAFVSWDMRTNKPIDIATCSGFFPLMTDVPSPAQVGALVTLMNKWGAKTRYLLPSFDPSHELFDPRRYWCGPVWINANYFIAKGFTRHGHPELAQRLLDDARRLVEMSGSREYFDPFNGDGLGGVEFSWTAALAMSWFNGAIA